MNNLIALLGSGEYLPVMNDVDKYLLSQTGAKDRAPRVVCLPTAAGAEGEASWGNWNRMGVEHFKALGADVTSLPIIDRATAEDEKYIPAIENADLIYFSGGDPNYLYQSLRDTKTWQAIQKARADGAIYAGCSAGAMVMGSFIPQLRTLSLQRGGGFGILSNCMIIPHFDRMMAWRGIAAPVIQTIIKDSEYSLGIDEDTALLGKPSEPWQVMGRQRVYVITKKEIKTYSNGDTVQLPY